MDTILAAYEGDPAASELNVQEGESVELLDTKEVGEGEGWRWVRSSTSGREGYVPQNFLGPSF